MLVSTNPLTPGDVPRSRCPGSLPNIIPGQPADLDRDADRARQINQIHGRGDYCPATLDAEHEHVTFDNPERVTHGVGRIHTPVGPP